MKVLRKIDFNKGTNLGGDIRNLCFLYPLSITGLGGVSITITKKRNFLFFISFITLLLVFRSLLMNTKYKDNKIYLEKSNEEKKAPINKDDYITQWQYLLLQEQLQWFISIMTIFLLWNQRRLFYLQFINFPH